MENVQETLVIQSVWNRSGTLLKRIKLTYVKSNLKLRTKWYFAYTDYNEVLRLHFFTRKNINLRQFSQGVLFRGVILKNNNMRFVHSLMFWRHCNRLWTLLWNLLNLAIPVIKTFDSKQWYIWILRSPVKRSIPSDLHFRQQSNDIIIYMSHRRGETDNFSGRKLHIWRVYFLAVIDTGAGKKLIMLVSWCQGQSLAT